MSKMMISGSEHPLRKIFSDDFFFTIPRYQRPYSWTTEQSEELFQDLIRAMDNFKETDDILLLPPYFLGSILISKGDEPQAEIIDGQQRLTTLTMLLAAIRSLIKSDFAEGLTAFLCEKGNIITGTPSRYRLKLRDSDLHNFLRARYSGTPSDEVYRKPNRIDFCLFLPYILTSIKLPPNELS
jgi:uncharacterized protein with ParB-like and HNH nuclease domain